MSSTVIQENFNLRFFDPVMTNVLFLKKQKLETQLMWNNLA